MSNNKSLLEEAIGKPAIQQLINLSIIYIRKMQSKPLLSKEIHEEFADLFLNVVKEAMAWRLNPEEVMEIAETENESMIELIHLFEAEYGDYIAQQISEGDDLQS